VLILSVETVLVLSMRQKLIVLTAILLQKKILTFVQIMVVVNAGYVAESFMARRRFVIEKNTQRSIVNLGRAIIKNMPCGRRFPRRPLNLLWHWMIYRPCGALKKCAKTARLPLLALGCT